MTTRRQRLDPTIPCVVDRVLHFYNLGRLHVAQGATLKPPMSWHGKIAMDAYTKGVTEARQEKELGLEIDLENQRRASIA